MSDSDPRATRTALLRHAGIDFAAGGGLVMAGLVGRPPLFAAATAGVYLAIVSVAWAGLRGHAPHRSLGRANRVTLVRAVLVSFFGGAAAVAPLLSAAELWVLACVGGLSLMLDGIDGWAARRDGTVSRFGAQFDQEIDAVFVLFLSLLVWALGHAGAWVLAIGFMRYFYLVLGWMIPLLRRPLVQRRRRQAICVVQVAVLLACVPPFLPPAMRTAATLAALALLALSFALDVAILARQPADPSTPGGNNCRASR